jgi:hypothetical protein
VAVLRNEALLKVLESLTCILKANLDRVKGNAEIVSQAWQQVNRAESCIGASAKGIDFGGLEDKYFVHTTIEYGSIFLR